ncbi:MAG: hypothetical protein L0241_01965 [Planctomycetia bacterium]|nr:hypothetical protein [Planctomycetia bacterium]
MAASNPPVAKAIYVCDQVVPNVARQTIDLLGVFNAFRLPTGQSVPYTLARMCVFVQMEDGLGDAELQVFVVSAATGQVIFHSPIHRVRFPNRLTVVSANIRLVNCPFPTAGEYWVELYCDGQIMGDRVVHVLV